MSTTSDSRGSAAPAHSAERVLELARCAVLVVDARDGAISWANPSAEFLFGHGPGELAGTLVQTFLPGWDAEIASAGAASSGPAEAPDKPAGRPVRFQARAQRLGGRSFTAEVDASFSAADDAFVVIVQDIGERAGRTSELQSLVSLLNATLESTADGLLVVGADGTITGINSRFAEMWGIPSTVLATHDDSAVMALVIEQLSDPAGFLTKVNELYAQPMAESLDLLDFKDGRVFERFSRPQMIADRVAGRVWSFRDITSRRRAEIKAERAMDALAQRAAELRTLAFTDPLTGLGNRALFNEVLEAARSSADGHELTLLLLDLDDFKEVNDVYGHLAGDQMLIEVARRLRSCVRTEDTVARLGGDEFVVILGADIDADAVARRILELSHQPVDLGGVDLRPSLSMGIATPDGSCEDSDCAAELLRRADIAMYAAKAAGKNRYVRFHPDMMTALLDRAELQNDLRRAVAEGAIFPVYQPVVAGDGRIVQLEALARWERGGELCEPGVFIPEAESSGLIRELGAQILAAACSETAGWLRGGPERSVAVNVSGLQVRHADYADSVLAALAEHGVRPHQLVLEVTESVFLGSEEEVIGQLTSLRNRGVRIAVDDFGTGYSSFGRLHELPVDSVKLDRSFTQRIAAVTDHSPVIISMIDMAHNLGMSVTAEGIETRVQADYLTRLGADFQQGYLYSRPLTIVALSPLLGPRKSPGT